MSDETIRDLERRARSGDHDALARLPIERARRGELLPDVPRGDPWVIVRDNQAGALMRDLIHALATFDGFTQEEPRRGLRDDFLVAYQDMINGMAARFGIPAPLLRMDDRRSNFAQARVAMPFLPSFRSCGLDVPVVSREGQSVEPCSLEQGHEGFCQEASVGSP